MRAAGDLTKALWLLVLVGARLAVAAPAEDMVLLYRFGEATAGWGVNLVQPGTMNLQYVARSAYGEWGTRMVWPDDPAVYPCLAVGRDGLLSALRTGTAPDAVGAPGWLPDAAAGYTVALWMRVPVPPEGEYFDGTVLNLGTGYKSGWRLVCGSAKWVPDGQLTLVCGTEEGSTDIRRSPFPPGVWHHVALVAAADAMTLYVDGELAGTTTESVRTPDPASRSRGVCIAAKWYSRAPVLDYRFDEFAGFRRALTATEIEALYRAGQPEDRPPPAELFGMRLAIPTATWGYFPAGQPIPLTFAVPPAVTVVDAAGMEVVRQQQAPPTVTLAEPGLYRLSMRLFDDAGRQVRETCWPLGICAGPVGGPVPWLGGPDLAIHPEPLAVGAGLSRVVCEWRQIEPAKDEYNWTQLDFRLLDPRHDGLDVLVCLTGLPPWLESSLDEPLDARGVTAYRTIWRKLLARYSGVRLWEVWDAPDRPPNSQRASLALYRQLLAVAAPGIRAAGGKVLGGGSWDASPAWARAVLADGGDANLDVLAIHSHFTDPAADNELAGRLRQLRTIGPELPIWNTGLGCRQPARLGWLPAAAAELPASWPIPVAAERRVAAAMVQSIVIQLAAGVERLVVDPGIATYHPSMNHTDGSPGWKGLALAMLRGQVGDSPRVRPVESPSPGIRLFAIGDGCRIAFAPGGEAPLRVAPARVLDMVGRPLAGADDTITIGAEPIYLLNAHTERREVPE